MINTREVILKKNGRVIYKPTAVIFTVTEVVVHLATGFEKVYPCKSRRVGYTWLFKFKKAALV